MADVEHARRWVDSVFQSLEFSPDTLYRTRGQGTKHGGERPVERVLGGHRATDGRGGAHSVMGQLGRLGRYWEIPPGVKRIVRHCYGPFEISE